MNGLVRPPLAPSRPESLEPAVSGSRQKNPRSEGALDRGRGRPAWGGRTVSRSGRSDSSTFAALENYDYRQADLVPSRTKKILLQGKKLGVAAVLSSECGQFLLFQPVQDGDEFRWWHGAAQQETLQVGTAEVLQHFHLRRRFYALGHRVHAEIGS